MSEKATTTTTTTPDAPAPAPSQLSAKTEASATDALASKPAAVPICPMPAVAGLTPATDPATTGTLKLVDEPQNPLTSTFTGVEWTAIKELRAKLPDIFAEAFPDKPNAKSTPVEIWGVTIDPGMAKDARVSVVLMKFLRARNLSVTEAQSMIISTLRWREQFKPDEVANEEFPKDIFGQLGHVYGQDKEGRPVTYNLYGANKDLKAVFGDIPRFIRWRVALMEKGVALLDFENVDQMVQVHDYEGVSISSRDANSKNAASEATNIFSSYYPELLFKKFFVNVPTLMTWIFWAFRPLLSAQTVAKMSVIGSGSHTIGKALLPVVEPDQLPNRYGGKADVF